MCSKKNAVAPAAVGVRARTFEAARGSARAAIALGRRDPRGDKRLWGAIGRVRRPIYQRSLSGRRREYAMAASEPGEPHADESKVSHPRHTSPLVVDAAFPASCAMSVAPAFQRRLPQIPKAPGSALPPAKCSCRQAVQCRQRHNTTANGTWLEQRSGRPT